MIVTLTDTHANSDTSRSGWSLEASKRDISGCIGRVADFAIASLTSDVGKKDYFFRSRDYWQFRIIPEADRLMLLSQMPVAARSKVEALEVSTGGSIIVLITARGSQIAIKARQLCHL